MSDIKETAVAATSEHDMLSGPVGRTYWRYSLPWAFSMVATASASVVDGIFVGRFAGAMSLAAVNMAAPTWSLLSGIGYMLVSGGSVRTGHYLGEGDREAASAMMIKTLSLLVAVLFFLSFVTYLCLDQVMVVLGVNDVLRPDSMGYISVLLWFAPVAPLCYGLSYFIRVDQRPVFASAGLALTAVINILLDALFVGYLGWGVRGAALATGISFTLPCLMFATHFFSGRSSYVWPRRWGGVKEVMFSAWNGASEFVNEVSGGFIILIFNRILMENLGAYGVAAFTVVNYSTLLCLILFYGMGDSLAPIVSVNLGAGKSRRAAAFLRTALIGVFSLGAAMFACFTFAPGFLAGLFLPGEPEATALTMEFIHAWRWAFLFSGINMVMASNFTGMQWAGSSMAVAISRSLVLPLLMLMLLPKFLGDAGIFYATSFAEAFTFIFAVALYAYGTRRSARR